ILRRRGRKGTPPGIENLLQIFGLEFRRVRYRHHDALLIDHDGHRNSGNTIDFPHRLAQSIKSDERMDRGLFQESLYDLLVLIAYGQELHRLPFESVHEFIPMRDGFSARSAPGCPEINDDNLAAQGLPRNTSARRSLQNAAESQWRSSFPQFCSFSQGCE